MKKEHIHKFENTGGGTGYNNGESTYSDVGYKCGCGQKFTMLMDTETYFERKYPKTFMTENEISGHGTRKI